MTDPAVASAQALANRADWMRAIVGELTGTGIPAAMRETFAWLDVSAAPATRQPSGHEPEASLDADGYAEIRWWNDTAATPAEVAARISRVLTAARLAPRPGANGTHAKEHT